MDQFANYELKVNLIGAFNMTIPAGQTVVSNFMITDKILMTGAEYFRTGNDLDQVDFNLKSSGEVVSILANGIFLSENNRYEFYKAVLIPGMEIELTYKNNGLGEANFRCNLIAHKEKV